MTRKDALLYQNARFYEAFERSSIEMMEDIWSESSAVRCIHPGWSIVEGRPAILESWQRIFEGDVRMKVALRKDWKLIHHHGSPTVVAEEQEGENFRYN